MSLNLNKKQILAFNLFKSKYNIFITGGAGTGKSFITCCSQDYIDSQQIDNESFSITSTTGISALNIGGITIHNWAGLDHNTPIRLLNCSNGIKYRGSSIDLLQNKSD